MVEVGIAGQSLNSLAYADFRPNIVPVVQARRRPTVTDKYYPLWTEWRVEENPTTGVVGEFWKLIRFNAGNAIWVLISGATGAFTALEDQSGIVVNPDPVNGEIEIDGEIVANGANALPLFTVADPANFILRVELQVTSAIASAPGNTNDAGVASFDSSQFTVDANGFVRTKGNTTQWLVINQSNQPTNFAVNTGYICQAGGTGNVSIALPATSILGDIIEIVLDGATSWTITQGAGQRIRVFNSQTTLGAAGSIATTLQGDHIRLVCETANARWVAVGAIGNLTVT